MGKKDPLQVLAGSGGSIVRKLAGVAVAIALMSIVVRFPADAADWVQQLMDWSSDIINGLVSFIRQVA